MEYSSNSEWLFWTGEQEEGFLESSHLIETHIDVVVEVLEIQSSFSFEFYLDED